MDVHVADHRHAPTVVEQLNAAGRSARVVSTPGDASTYLAFDEDLSAWNRQAVAANVPLIAVECGTVGGRTIEEFAGAVTCCTPDGPCFACLETRIEANAQQTTDASTCDPAESILLASMGGMFAARPQLDDGGTVTTLPFGDHELLPVPDCPVCASPSDARWRPESAPARSPRSLAAAATAGERTVGDLVGIVTEVGEARSLPSPYFLVTLADTTPFSDVQAPRQAAGVADDWDEAFMKGIGEGIERYAAGIYTHDSFRRASPDDVQAALDPASCVNPAGEDLDTGEIAWVPGEALASGRDVWLPAELVVFPPPSRKIRPPITTGLSLGNTIDEAIAGGLAEVVERDATMLAWYSTFEPLALAVDDPTYDRLERRAAFENLELETMLVTQDIDLPVVACLAHRDRWPALALGSAAGLDATQAAIRAAEEALQNWMELDEMGEATATDEAERLAAHARDPTPARTGLAAVGTVDAAAVSQATDAKARERRDRIVELISTAGMTGYAARTTTRDVERLGFEGVRVIVPTAQPLILGEPYFGDRAETVPASLGYSPCLDRSPHPFP